MYGNPPGDIFLPTAKQNTPKIIETCYASSNLVIDSSQSSQGLKNGIA
ncbi:MAG: hypothetical protein PHO23_00340 [Candidatus Pacebacteria bacterium]|nr:hypothetical protein [Candidatus Paceibacterota bacterium]